ncbi:putative 5-oxoprolinase, partial [Cardiosporidium cionae]
ISKAIFERFPFNENTDGISSTASLQRLHTLSHTQEEILRERLLLKRISEDEIISITSYISIHRRELGFEMDCPLVVEAIRTVGCIIAPTSTDSITLYKDEKVSKNHQIPAVVHPSYNKCFFETAAFHSSQRDSNENFSLMDNPHAANLPSSSSSLSHGCHVSLPLYQVETLNPGTILWGPALLCDIHTTILLEPFWNLIVLPDSSFLLEYIPSSIPPIFPSFTTKETSEMTPTLFSNRESATREMKKGIERNEKSNRVSPMTKIEAALVAYSSSSSSVAKKTDDEMFFLSGKSDEKEVIASSKHASPVYTPTRLPASSQIEKQFNFSIPADPITLAVFGHRFMGIAEQMGKMLQRISVSVNIKQRLDFSCALFREDGTLIANAPHVPVHLGAMQEAVKHQLSIFHSDCKPGDVILCNHPACGGSHLPDLTVITPVWHVQDESSPPKIILFVASRGHHADIGGNIPGSMPPFSKSLAEEGVAIRCFKLVDKTLFQTDACIALLGHQRETWTPTQMTHYYKQAEMYGNICASPPSRRLKDNLNDLKAQVAANQKGVQLLHDLITAEGLEKVLQYTLYLQEASAESVKELIAATAERVSPLSDPPVSMVNASAAVENSIEFTFTDSLPKMEPSPPSLPPVTLEAMDYMDDGSCIHLRIILNREKRTALFDFRQSGPQVYGNLNTPIAVTKSAIIYCLRTLVNEDIPLNHGCLQPVDILFPNNSFLNPTEDAAVVAGNVLTSQRIADVIFKAFGACADSYGCMNNLTFGGAGIAFYETIGGGSGAGPSWNGTSGVQCHMTNTRITDVETIERKYPVIVHVFKLREESGGIGRFRGGNGIHREFEFLQDGIVVSILSERRCRSPEGSHGGGPGKMGQNLWLRLRHNHLRPGALSSQPAWAYQTLSLGGKNSVTVGRGDRIVILTPGGGGYGYEKTAIPQNN